MNMTIKNNQVYLVQGQFKQVLDGVITLDPEIKQLVVVAKDNETAYQFVTKEHPGFKPLGYATLEDYEKTARKLRDTLKGINSEWPLLIAADLSN